MGSGIVMTNRWGEVVPAEKILTANHLWNARQTKSLWEVVEEVIKVFKETQPRKWDSYVVQLSDTKENAGVESVGGKRFRGVTKDRSDTNTKGMINVHQIDMPVWIMLCLRKLYTEEELSFTGPEGKKFFREFGRRFPLFRIHEVV